MMCKKKQGEKRLGMMEGEAAGVRRCYGSDGRQEKQQRREAMGKRRCDVMEGKEVVAAMGPLMCETKLTYGHIITDQMAGESEREGFPQICPKNKLITLENCLDFAHGSFV